MDRREFSTSLFSVPVMIGLAGSILLLIGTFLEFGAISFLSFNYSFGLEDLRLGSMLVVIRLLALLSIGILLIPRIPKAVYSACFIIICVIVASKFSNAVKNYMDALDLLKVTGLSNYFDPSDYLKMKAGFYMMVIGGILMAVPAVYYLIAFFRKEEN